jgi:hypothetical protein
MSTTWSVHNMPAVQAAALPVIAPNTPAHAGDMQASDPMLAALGYWLHASGIPATFHLVAGFKQRSSSGGAAQPLQVEAFEGLFAKASALCGHAIDARRLQGVTVQRQAKTEPAVNDSLMYG